jgi:hypothetical protein
VPTLLSPRQGVVDLVEQFRSPRQGTVSLSEFRSPRQGLVGLTVDQLSPRQGTVRLWSAQFHKVMVGLDQISGEDWIAQSLNIVPRPKPTIQYAGLDLGPLLAGLTVTLPLNGKTTAQLELNSPVDVHNIVIEPSDICPPGYGVYANKIRQHDGTATRKVSIDVGLAGEVANFPTLLPSPAQWDAPRLSWPLEDLTALLEEDNPDFYLDDILLAEGDLRMAHSSAKEEAQLAGLTVECRYPDYLIGEHRRGSGSLLKRLDALAAPMQAARRFERRGSQNVLVYEQVNPNRAPKWKFEDRKNVQTLDLQEMPRALNSFVLSRFTPAGGYIGEAQGDKPGRQSITFEPSRFVSIDQVKALSGALINWVFFAGPTVVGGFGGGALPFYQGSLQADRAEFTYEPNFLQAPSTISVGIPVYGYEVLARGGALKKEESYRFPAEDTAHQALYGIRRAGSINETILGDAAGAALSVQARLMESIRKVWRCSLVTPYLNPFVRPGDIIALKDKRRRQNWTRWVVELVVYVWTGRTWNMKLECTRGEQ